MKIALEKERDCNQQALEEWKKREKAWSVREKELKIEIGVRPLTSFRNCIRQVCVLYPDLDLSPLDAFKEVRDGEIVSLSESEDESSEHEEDQGSAPAV